MSKEYTYDIGKYTIGVDENGEDGIGMTIAIIKNGGIYFLGNCYGENARCIDLLIKENQELKKQLNNCYCNRTDCVGRIKDSKVYDSLEQKVKNQQKEFMKYLENYMKQMVDDYGSFKYDKTSVTSGEYKAYKEILQKYKEIIGGK